VTSSLTSGFFTFTVGKEQTPINVHTSIIAAQSTVFHDFLYGPRNEDERSCAALPHVERETFEMFCEFAYFGNFHPPKYTEAKARPDSLHSLRVKAQTPDEGCDVSSGHGSSTEEGELVVKIDLGLPPVAAKKLDRQVVKPQTPVCIYDDGDEEPFEGRRGPLLYRKFDHLDFDAPKSRNMSVQQCMARANESAAEDYTPVFLGLAKLYVFADEWGVSRLKTLALSKLYMTLEFFSVYNERIRDVLSLARFAYDEENTPDVIDDPDDLRAVVAHFMANNFKKLAESDRLFATFQGSGAMMRDVMGLVMSKGLLCHR
jgi:hypothetical protein